MTRLIRWATGLGLPATVFLGLLGAGCGTGAPPDNHYRGSFRSQYSIPATNEVGTFTFSVAQKGDMVGSFVDANTNTTNSFAGTINNNGHFDGNVTVGGAAFPISGTLNITGTTGSVPGGNFEETRAGVPVEGSFSLLTVATSPTNSAFAGAYANPASIPGFAVLGSQSALPTASNLSITVDTEGKFVGSVGALTLLGSISSDGRFTGQLGNFDAGGNPIGAAYPITGKLARAGVAAISVASGLKVTSPGIAGDFTVIIAGQQFSGFLQAAGG
jgi:hypothetical protein